MRTCSCGYLLYFPLVVSEPQRAVLGTRKKRIFLSSITKLSLQFFFFFFLFQSLSEKRGEKRLLVAYLSLLSKRGRILSFFRFSEGSLFFSPPISVACESCEAHFAAKDFLLQLISLTFVTGGTNKIILKNKTNTTRVRTHFFFFAFRRIRGLFFSPLNTTNSVKAN